jgi:hypothetical protein
MVNDDLEGLVSVSRPVGFDLVKEGRHIPRRNDDVVRWLKMWRDRYPKDEVCPEIDIAYDTVDAMLEDYKTRVDYGYTLTEHVEGHL